MKLTGEGLDEADRAGGWMTLTGEGLDEADMGGAR